MDHLKILKRAWNIVKNYRALWILGLILALTITSGGGGSSSGGSASSMPSPDRPEEWEWNLDKQGREGFREFFESTTREFEGGLPGWAIATIIVGSILMLALTVIFTILRYRAETSQLKMVDAYEEDGTELSFKQGWRLGKTRAAWRMFLLDLGVGLAVFLAVVVMLGIAALPNLAWLTGSEGFGIFGTVISVILALMCVLVFITGGIYISWMMRLARRLIVLDDQRPMDAIRQGFKLARKHWKSVGLMWLIMAGLGIAWIIAQSIAAFIVAILSLFVGGILGLLTFAISNLIFATMTAGIIGGIVGFLLFLVVISPPLLFINGMWINYEFTVWTLTYRELTAAAVFDIENPDELIAPAITEENESND